MFNMSIPTTSIYLLMLLQEGLNFELVLTVERL